MRNKEDLTKIIVEVQNRSPTPGDFVELVDFMKTGKKYDDHWKTLL